MSATAILQKARLKAAFGQSRGGRDYQEDSVRLEPDAGPAGELLVLVADGMGGYEGGDVASRAAADGFMAAVRHAADHPVAARLEAGLAAADTHIAEAKSAGRGSAEMGCTLLGVVADAEELAWISVGDSPLYIWTGSQGLRRLNEDHSMAPVIDKMATDGVITLDEAASDPQRHALRSALTGEDLPLVDKGRAAWPPGGALVLASDGLNTLADPAIAEILAHAEGDPEKAVAALLAAVEAIGDPHQDNTTVAVVFHEPPPAPGQASKAVKPPAAADATIHRWRALALFGAIAAMAVLAVAVFVLVRMKLMPA